MSFSAAWDKYMADYESAAYMSLERLKEQHAQERENARAPRSGKKKIRNARLFVILLARNFWRVCSQFRLSVRNSV